MYILHQRGIMQMTILIVFGLLALLGAGDTDDVCAITLLVIIMPFLFIAGTVASFAFCGG